MAAPMPPRPAVRAPAPAPPRCLAGTTTLSGPRPVKPPMLGMPPSLAVEVLRRCLRSSSDDGKRDVAGGATSNGAGGPSPAAGGAATSAALML